MNSAFVGYEELSRSRRVFPHLLSASVVNTFEICLILHILLSLIHSLLSISKMTRVKLVGTKYQFLVNLVMDWLAFKCLLETVMKNGWSRKLSIVNLIPESLWQPSEKNWSKFIYPVINKHILILIYLN